MDAKDKFDLLYEALKDEFKGQTDNLVRTWAGIGLAIGWILTSDKSREFLAKETTAYRWLLAAIVVISLIHALVSIAYYLRSRHVFDLLIREFTDIDPLYIEKECYSSYKLTRLMIAQGLMVSFFLFAVLFMMVFSIK